MPITTLALIVVIGLGAIWTALWAFGFTRSLVLDEAIVRAEFAADNPGRTIDEITVAASGQAALIRSGHDLFVLWVMGQDVATHGLSGAEPAPSPSGLRLRLPDFAAPHPKLALTPAEVKSWAETITKEA